MILFTTPTSLAPWSNVTAPMTLAPSPPPLGETKSITNVNDNQLALFLKKMIYL